MKPVFSQVMGVEEDPTPSITLFDCVKNEMDMSNKAFDIYETQIIEIL